MGFSIVLQCRSHGDDNGRGRDDARAGARTPRPAARHGAIGRNAHHTKSAREHHAHGAWIRAPWRSLHGRRPGRHRAAATRPGVVTKLGDASPGALGAIILDNPRPLDGF